MSQQAFSYAEGHPKLWSYPTCQMNQEAFTFPEGHPKLWFYPTCYMILGNAIPLLLVFAALRGAKAPRSPRLTPGLRPLYAVNLFLLAVISIISCLALRVVFLWDSYRVWANQKNLPIPTVWYGLDGIWEPGTGITLIGGAWYKDTFDEPGLWQSGLSTNAKTLFTQQLWSGATIWAIYVALEGRRRSIPHLWAFIALIPMSLSAAQAFFFVAVLQRPSTNPKRSLSRGRPKQSEQSGAGMLITGALGWAPKGFWLALAPLITLIHFVLLRHLAHQQYWSELILLSAKLSFLLPLVFTLLPDGTESSSKFRSRASQVFQWLAMLSCFASAVQTALLALELRNQANTTLEDVSLFIRSPDMARILLDLAMSIAVQLYWAVTRDLAVRYEMQIAFWPQPPTGALEPVRILEVETSIVNGVEVITSKSARRPSRRPSQRGRPQELDLSVLSPHERAIITAGNGIPGDAAALAMALELIGGLGLMSSAVFGATLLG